MQIEQLDHLVLTVRDIGRTVAFYTQVMGLQEVTFGAGRRALVFGGQKLNLHEQGRGVEPTAARPTPGSADLCFVTGAPLEAVLQTLAREGVPVVEGPVVRTGARGPIESVYFRDPDGNLIEVSRYVR